ncbi:hypothetical protein [Streptomyces sp. NPDC048172]|uniref:hypothetical protein n=1 Tax=Streptomyces sp. NPDC048172 TaxID=3365505 RepID=UPI00371C8D3D
MRENPDIAFEQPLFHSSRLAADWERMRAHITSATELESAYSVIQPQISDLGIQLSDSDAGQLMDLYNAAVKDGRYLDDLVSDPAGVAKRLKMRISKNAAAELKRAGSIEALRTEQGKAAIGPGVAVVVVAVVIVVVFGPKDRPRPQVVDSSGVVKI